jgi:acylphosphatase
MHDGSHTEAMIVVVEGRVQGVSFRAWAQAEARDRGVRGWVRNRGDGSVEALLEGSTDALNALVEAMRCGPPAAKVTRLETRPVAPSGAQTFDIGETT